MSKQETVKAEIMRTIARELDSHLFSEKNYPVKIIITTYYEKARQELVIEMPDMASVKNAGGTSNV